MTESVTDLGNLDTRPEPDEADAVRSRAQALFDEQRDAIYQRTDRMFAVLMVVQWLFGIVIALVFSPYGWEGKTRVIHAHVYIAVLLGGGISSLPVLLALTRPGWAGTRYVIAVAQMLWSGLLIHLSGGRIETHFHVFGSLAFLAFYRDWRVLLPATAVVAADHVLRQFLWPESVYGVLTPETWRFLEHAFWVVFEDVFLVLATVQSVREMRTMAQRRAESEALSQRLDRSVNDLRNLAASVGHELRNPIAAVRNAAAYVSKRLADKSAAAVAAAAADPKVPQFLALMDRELNVCTKIISDLLDFARQRPIALSPCPLRPLVEEAISLVSAAQAVSILNEVPEDLPVPNLDRDQFRQVLINLLQNAVEALPPGGAGQVIVRADGGSGRPLRVSVSDNGTGISAAARAHIFEPLFTTKTKGTGLGLAIVQNGVKRHNGAIEIESEPGRGTTFHIDLPVEAPAAAYVESRP